VKDNSFRAGVTHRSGFRSKDLDPCNLSTTIPLVINNVTIRLTLPRRLIPACETKNTSKNSKEAALKLGFHKPITVTVLRQKTLSKNPPLNQRWLLSLWRGRVVLGLWENRRGRPRLGPRAQLDTQPSWPKIGDATPCRGHTA
jgi:hypothetical protein